jgi:hypothetical protein
MLAIVFGRFKLKKLKLKNPVVVWHGVKDLPLGGREPAAVLIALAQEMDYCRRSPWRQGLNAVLYDGRSLAP